MESQVKKSPHPLMWMAGIAITLFSAAGIAAIMGWIPTSTGTPSEKTAISKPANAPAKRAAAGTHAAPAQVAVTHKALEIIWKVVADANRYFAGQEPWALKKTDPERMNTVLYTTAEVIRVVATAAQPFIPGAAAKLLDLLSVAEDKRQFGVEKAALVPGTALPKPEGVFPRYVEPDAVA